MKITRAQAECLLEAYRILNGLAHTDVGKDSMLMLTWRVAQDILRRGIQFGGWRMYHSPASNQMEIEE